jgi:hypothetical protein
MRYTSTVQVDGTFNAVIFVTMEQVLCKRVVACYECMMVDCTVTDIVKHMVS